MLSKSKRSRLELYSEEPTLVLADDDGLEKVNEPQVQADKKGLQTWIFDVRSKKRYYISRTGKCFSGADASRVYRIEKNDVLGSASARNELHYLMNLVLPRLKEPGTSNKVDWGKLCSWGVPPRIETAYKEYAGVERLFDWQIDVLRNSVQSEQKHSNCCNLIYSAPTSGGKTLVAEILMLRRLVTKGVIIFVVPFVALAEQKTEYFQEIWKDLQVGIRPFHAEQSLTGLTSDIDVAVCTIEKANMLINTLFEEGRQDQLSMVVLDEFHMLADPSRGFILEILVAKCLHLLPHRTQIVGMSATKPNLEEISKWLGGQFYSSQFRPTTLDVKVCSAHILYRLEKSVASKVQDELIQAQNLRKDLQVDLKLLNQLFRQERVLMYGSQPRTGAVNCDSKDAQRNLQPKAKGVSHMASDLGDSVVLTLEGMRQGLRTVVFCGTKASVESTAVALYNSIIGGLGDARNSTENPSESFYLLPLDDKRGRLRLLDSLRHTQGGLHPMLAKTILGGVAFHHSGLMPEQRKFIERGFTEGYLRIIVATTTLAAGVNLPADRVIVSGMRTGVDPLSVSAFRQMCGRAGRTGLKSSGESILVVGDLRGPSKASERRDLVHLMVSEPDPLLSRLHQGRGGGLERLMLDIAACACSQSIVQEGKNGDNTRANVVKDGFLSCSIACTLLSRQYSRSEVERHLKEAKVYLVHHGFLIPIVMPAAAESLSDPRLHSDEGTIDEKVQSTNLYVSPLGRATLASGISPHEAVQNLRFLEDAKENLVLKGDIHPLFLVTPPNLRVRVRWEKFIHIWDDLCDLIPEVQDVCVSVLGVDPGMLQSFVSNPPTGPKLDAPETIFYRRFYCTIILLSLVSPSPTNVVDRHMNLGPSEVYALQREASMFCRGTTTFCRELNWTFLAAALESYSERLSFGVQEQLLPLVRACGPELMHGRRARHLYSHGITGPADLIACSRQDLANLILREQPFSSSEPLDRARHPTISKMKIHDDKGGPDGVKSYCAEDAAASCLSLAGLIQRKAKVYVTEETQMALFMASVSA